MSIKSLGGVFGRNPTFNDVTVEGDLSIDGTLTIGGSVITGLNLQGNWNASTNTPDLTVLTPDAGKFWIVSVAGSTNLGGFTNWTVGDWALYDGSAWQRIEGGTVDLSNAVTGTLAITNGGTGASTASTARTNLGSGTVGDNLFTATTALAAQQAMDTEVGVDVQPYDATILKSADIGVTVEAYDSTILKSADIGVSVQGYDADTAKYDDTTANFTGTLQNGGSNVVVDNDIGVTVEAYDATILKSADIGSTVQGYDADTAKYDDTTANFTGTLQNGGSNVVVDSDIGSTVQAYDADTAKLDVNQTWTGTQAFDGAVVINEAGADVDFRIESDTDTHALFLDAGNSRVGINTSDPVASLQSGVTSLGATSIPPGEAVFASAATANNEALLIFGRGNIDANGNTGVTFSFNPNRGASGAATGWYQRVDGATAAGYMSFGQLIRAASGSATLDEHLRIDSSSNLKLNSGNLIIGTSGKGIDFSATPGTGTSELFDDYEEGTFTPTVSGVTLTIAVGRYTKVGRTVFVEIFLRFPSTADATVTKITSLPFSPSTGGNVYFGGVNVSQSISTHVKNRVEAGQITPYKSDGTNFTNANFSGADVAIGGWYSQ